MRRLAVILLVAFAATRADGQSAATACWLGSANTTCFKPVIHTSMEGPASVTVSGYLSSADWKTFNASGGTVTAVTGTPPVASSGGTTPAISMHVGDAADNGYLASGDWAIFNSRQPAGSYALQATAINTTSPLAGGGDLSTTRTLSIPVATVTANGYLASADWATFNGKGGTYTQGNLTEATSAVLTIGGGTSSVFGSGTTIQVTKSDASHPGYLASADWATFNGKDQARTVGNLTEATSAVLTIGSGTGAVIGSGTTIQVTKAAAAANGYLGSSDWQVFNSRQPAGSYALQATAINTTSPLAGGGDLSTTRTLSIPPANATTNGYLASGDWVLFNGAAPTARNINTTAPITGGGNLSADRTIAMPVATSTANGYLASTDWVTFNSKTSGRYTPTLTNVANVAATTPRNTHFIRVGNEVIVCGEADVDPTSGAVLTQLGVSLPIASDIVSFTDLFGTMSSNGGTITSANIEGDTTNDRATISYTPSSAANNALDWCFMYQVQ